MFCTMCGTKLADDANFCDHCGTKVGASVDLATTPARARAPRQTLAAFLAQSEIASAQSDRIYFAPDIPLKKLSHALDYADGVADTDVVALIDDSAFGSAKEGALITNDGVIVKVVLERPRKYLFASTKSITSEGNKVFVDGHQVASFTMPSKRGTAELFHTLQQYLRVAPLSEASAASIESAPIPKYASPPALLEAEAEEGDEDNNDADAEGFDEDGVPYAGDPPYPERRFLMEPQGYFEALAQDLQQECRRRGHREDALEALMNVFTLDVLNVCLSLPAFLEDAGVYCANNESALFASDQVVVENALYATMYVSYLLVKESGYSTSSVQEFIGVVYFKLVLMYVLFLEEQKHPDSFRTQTNPLESVRQSRLATMYKRRAACYEEAFRKQDISAVLAVYSSYVSGPGALDDSLACMYAQEVFREKAGHDHLLPFLKQTSASLEQALVAHFNRCSEASVTSIE